MAAAAPLLALYTYVRFANAGGGGAAALPCPPAAAAAGARRITIGP